MAKIFSANWRPVIFGMDRKSGFRLHGFPTEFRNFIPPLSRSTVKKGARKWIGRPFCRRKPRNGESGRNARSFGIIPSLHGSRPGQDVGQDVGKNGDRESDRWKLPRRPPGPCFEEDFSKLSVKSKNFVDFHFCAGKEEQILTREEIGEGVWRGKLESCHTERNG
jgi:hypothetical protein